MALSFSSVCGKRPPSLSLALALSLYLACSAFAASKQTSASDFDEHELVTAADDAGHVYLIYPEYRQAQGCSTCWLPAITLVASSDNGSHWDAPRSLMPTDSAQVDPQLAVDADDHRIVYSAWLQAENTELAVAKSADFGQSWSVVVADREFEDAARPVLAARGSNVYVAFTRANRLWMASSHDGGITFSVNEIGSGSLTAPWAGSVATDGDGGVYVAWAGHPENTAPDQVNLYVSRWRPAENRWVDNLMDISPRANRCGGSDCSWGDTQSQISLAADSAGVLYAVWNSSPSAETSKIESQRIYFASSTTRGETWSTKAELSHAPRGTRHALPFVVAGSAGTVRVAWIDSRESPEWNTYFRTSTNGGATWSPETRVSSHPLASLYGPFRSSQQPVTP